MIGARHEKQVKRGRKAGVLNVDQDKGFTADELIAGTAIAAKIISENPGLDESAIDAALFSAYVKGSSAEEWETRTRRLLGLNPHDKKDC